MLVINNIKIGNNQTLLFLIKIITRKTPDMMPEISFRPAPYMAGKCAGDFETYGAGVRIITVGKHNAGELCRGGVAYFPIATIGTDGVPGTGRNCHQMMKNIRNSKM